MKKLQEYENESEKILNNIKEGVLLLDNKFMILWANKAVMDNLRLKESDIIGEPCYKITHHRKTPCLPPDDICPVRAVVEKNIPITVTHTHFDKEGNKIYVEVSAYPIRDNNGNIVEFVHISRDVTQRKIAEEKLKSKTKELERFYKLTVGRELKMTELKKKVKKLDRQLKKENNICQASYRLNSGD